MYANGECLSINDCVETEQSTRPLCPNRALPNLIETDKKCFFRLSTGGCANLAPPCARDTSVSSWKRGAFYKYSPGGPGFCSATGPKTRYRSKIVTTESTVQQIQFSQKPETSACRTCKGRNQFPLTEPGPMQNAEPPADSCSVPARLERAAVLVPGFSFYRMSLGLRIQRENYLC